MNNFESSNNKTFRAFIAIDLPEELKERLAKICAQVAKNNKLKNIKWTKSQNLHITLRFLGNITQKQFECITQKLASWINLQPSFELNLKEIVPFPKIDKAKLLVVLPKPSMHSILLALKIDKDVVACGIPKINHPFIPHLTLGRKLDGFVKNTDKFLIPEMTFKVEIIKLFLSEPSSAGSNYTALYNFELKK